LNIREVVGFKIGGGCEVEDSACECEGPLESSSGQCFTVSS